MLGYSQQLYNVDKILFFHSIEKEIEAKNKGEGKLYNLPKVIEIINKAGRIWP